jgi:polysaccharide biosynthesis/export protein
MRIIPHFPCCAILKLVVAFSFLSRGIYGIADESKPTASESSGQKSGYESWAAIYEQIVNQSSSSISSLPAPGATTLNPPTTDFAHSSAGGVDPALASHSVYQGGTIDAKTYSIMVGDKIGYRVVEDNDEPRTLYVGPSGEVDIPLLGKYPVAGKRLTDAAKEIGRVLEKELYKQATVILSVEETSLSKIAPAASSISSSMASSVPVKPKQLTIVGQVRSPGIQDIPSYEDKYLLSRAILRAGGFASFANGKRVKIIRVNKQGQKQTIEANVLSVLEEGNLEDDIEVKPDDMIIVPEKLFNF